jgi:hypothetical protein
MAQPALADLTHRYNFNGDANDSVGTAHGTVMGGVTFVNNEAVFPASVASGPESDYIELPSGLISNYTAVTFQFWASPGASGTWAEIYGFGNQNASGQGANMLMFCPKDNVFNYRMSYAQADPGYNDEPVLLGGGSVNEIGPLSITCVYDPPNNKMVLYKNGILINTLTPVKATTAAKQFSLTNVYNVYSWLGRSLYNGDSAYNGTLNEFRIYNAALSPIDIAVAEAVGPDVVVTNYMLTGGTWNVVTNMVIGERQDSTATLTFAYNGTQTGTATVVSLSDPVYSSSDTNVAVISSTGRVMAMSPGTATVTAVYLGQTFNRTVIITDKANLVHRYTFDTNADDAMGTANGTLMGGAMISGKAVVLSGTGSSGSPGDYVDLPNGLLTNMTGMTIETWVTDAGSSTWARIFDFGNSVGGEDTSTGGGNNMFLSQPAGGSVLRGVLNRGNGEQQANAGALTKNKESHVAYVIDAAHTTSYLYVDGALKAKNTGTTLAPCDLGYTRNNWLGRAQYNDPMFNGSIGEFRIWQGALSTLQVAVNAATGKDTLGTTNPGEVQAVHLTVPATLIKGGVQSAAVTADFTAISGVNAASLGVTYASANTNIATVSADGLITAVSFGDTTITVTLSGKSDTKPISVLVKPTVLSHRWSFDETSGTSVADSVGSAAGTLGGSAAFDGAGSVTLDGVSAYVDLPANLISGYDALTCEMWATVNSATLADSTARLFVFGSGDGTNEVSMTVNNGDNNTTIQYFGSVNMTAVEGGSLGLDQQLHIVGVFNPPQGTISFYVNGSWQNAATNVGYTLGAVSNLISRLCGNLSGGGFTAANINEFRMYNGALDLFGIRASLAAGPGKVVTNLTTATSVTLDANLSMAQGSKALAHVKASFADVSDVDLTDTGAASFTSSDPSVLTITSDGLVQAVGAGTANLTASYGGKSDTKSITVYPKQTMLVNRYSFTNDAVDSVGAQDGVLWGSAQISDGKVVLAGDSSLLNSYVELPKRLISSYDAVTLECWVNLSSTVSTWARVFDFGNQTPGANGDTYVFLTRIGDPGTRIVLKDSGAEAIYNNTGMLLEGFSGHIAVVYDPPTDTQLLYTNGVLVGSGGLSGKVLSGVNDVHNWLGKSLYQADPGLTGEIDEFRVYAGALTAAQVAASYAAGPDVVALTPPVGVGPKLTVAATGGNLVITWPSSSTGFSLKTSSTLGTGASWGAVSQTPIIVGSNYQVTIPIGTGTAFYRLSN